ncbi:MAG: hypothetical protein M0R77_00240 [Gammaproteobacteria bacterium]|nr:hypothetical protein [Acholeplasmataceae bacterium]MCK9528983.1 hypothetical protein [Gammaproteobacteria bacterium]
MKLPLTDFISFTLLKSYENYWKEKYLKPNQVELRSRSRYSAVDRLRVPVPVLIRTEHGSLLFSLSSSPQRQVKNLTNKLEDLRVKVIEYLVLKDSVTEEVLEYYRELKQHVSYHRYPTNHYLRNFYIISLLESGFTLINANLGRGVDIEQLLKQYPTQFKDYFGNLSSN